jgi:hypothetical protein
VEAADLQGLIDGLIQGLRSNLKGTKAAGELHGLVVDLTRVLQLRKELIPVSPKEVTVRWIEEVEKKNEQ